MASLPAPPKVWLLRAGAGAAEYDSAREALEAAAGLEATVQLGAGVYNEGGSLSVGPRLSLVGAGADLTFLHCSRGSALRCAAGAVRVAGLTIHQTEPTPAQPAYALEMRGGGQDSRPLRIEKCSLSASSAAKLSAALLVHGARVEAHFCDFHAPVAAGVLLVAGAYLDISMGEVANCGGCGICALPGSILCANGLEIRACNESAILASKGSR
eukprot:scaffold67160_cov28-Tisochrysis_lutea.AAC.8